jgi:hypothetical protein
MASKKDDILDFLDAKFAKFKKADKKSKKSKKEAKAKEEVHASSLIKEIDSQKVQPRPKVTQDSLYTELVSDKELSKLNLSNGNDSLGVK